MKCPSVDKERGTRHRDPGTTSKSVNRKPETWPSLSYKTADRRGPKAWRFVPALIATAGNGARRAQGGNLANSASCKTPPPLELGLSKKKIPSPSRRPHRPVCTLVVARIAGREVASGASPAPQRARLGTPVSPEPQTYFFPIFPFSFDRTTDALAGIGTSAQPKARHVSQDLPGTHVNACLWVSVRSCGCS